MGSVLKRLVSVGLAAGGNPTPRREIPLERADPLTPRPECSRGTSAAHLVFLRYLSPKTVWPSGLRHWLQAPVRKGVGSNPTAVIRAGGSWGLGNFHGAGQQDAPTVGLEPTTTRLRALRSAN